MASGKRWVLNDVNGGRVLVVVGLIIFMESPIIFIGFVHDGAGNKETRI
jgi:hypothetical protein